MQVLGFTKNDVADNKTAARMLCHKRPLEVTSLYYSLLFNCLKLQHLMVLLFVMIWQIYSIKIPKKSMTRRTAAERVIWKPLYSLGKKRKKRFLLLWKCAAEKSPGGLAAHVGEKYGGVTALHTDRSIQTQQSCREKDSNDQKERGSQEWRK